MSTIQHAVAQELLPIIYSAAQEHRDLTYGTAAELLGRDGETNSRMVAQVCDLLDACAALAGVPLLALTAVRMKSGKINHKAWRDTEPEIRKRIIDASLGRQFNQADHRALDDALTMLKGKGNRAAWKYVRSTFPGHLYPRVTMIGPLPSSDAIEDLDSDMPTRTLSIVMRYSRNPKIREAVISRAGGKCEFCGEFSFLCSDGTRYLECHHIIALANDGEDRMTNVIALCPAHHREAHYGKRAVELEKKMIEKTALVVIDD